MRTNCDAAAAIATFGRDGGAPCRCGFSGPGARRSPRHSGAPRPATGARGAAGDDEPSRHRDEQPWLDEPAGRRSADQPTATVELPRRPGELEKANTKNGPLVIRGKFKARAGRRFALGWAVFSAVHRAFRDNGIVAV